MSHLTVVKCVNKEGVKIPSNNMSAWQLAAHKFGGTLHENQTTYKCYAGGWQGDSPRPHPLWTTDMWGKCSHAISFPDCEYELGLVELGDELVPIVDDWAGARGLHALLGGRGLSKLVSAYAESVSQLEQVGKIFHAARVRNYPVTQTVLPNNVVRLSIRVP